MKIEAFNLFATRKNKNIWICNLGSLEGVKMENNRFCDLVVGDKIYEYFEGNTFEHIIKKIENQIGNIYLDFENGNKEIIYKKYAELDFMIYSQDVYCDGISWAIATSMDKLLLECEN